MSLRILSQVDTGVDVSAPLKTLYHSHEGIVKQLRELGELPRLAQQMAQARRVSAASVALFRNNVLVHHQDEERDLFPAVIGSASPGAERESAQALAARLVAEHRDLEQMWKTLEPSVRAVARGRAEGLDAALLERLVQAYVAHARFEEEHFLPLAQAILERNPNHLGAVGVALHMRRKPGLPGYI
jgi:hemerythrin-like domain-containing protein